MRAACICVVGQGGSCYVAVVPSRSTALHPVVYGMCCVGAARGSCFRHVT